MARRSVVVSWQSLALCLALLVLTVVATVATPEVVQAQTNRCGTTFLYYSDSTYTEVVGIRSWEPEACNCRFSSWGTLSAYRQLEPNDCFF